MREPIMCGKIKGEEDMSDDKEQRESYGMEED